MGNNISVVVLTSFSMNLNCVSHKWNSNYILDNETFAEFNSSSRNNGLGSPIAKQPSHHHHLICHLDSKINSFLLQAGRIWRRLMCEAQ